MKRLFQKSCSATECAVRCALPLTLVLLAAGVATACPTCTDGLAQNDPRGQSIAAGFYYSILFMMSMPFLIVATFGSLAYLSIRRARTAGVSCADAETPTLESSPSEAEAVTRR